MNLTDEQKQLIAQRLNGGDSIADIQKLINDEFGVHMTFMETRFLIDDLNLDLKQEEPKTEKVDALSAAESLSSIPAEDATATGSGSVSVEIDKVVRPGAAISGSVTFSDGVGAKWYVDTMGRLGLESEQEGYQPSQEDVEAFQTELQSKMQAPGL